MKKLLKILGVLLLILLLVGGGAIAYVSMALPNIDAPADLNVEATAERVERGRYLANSVCVCMDCHSTRDWNLFAAPLEPGTFGGGGEKFDRTMQFPGEFYSKNITPFGLKDWTDGEIYRAITSGVSKDGHPFFPVMPYPNYNKLATEDVYSIIAYLRSLDPLETETYPASVIDFPVNLIMRTVPEPAHPVERPKPTDPTYGAYMVNAAACVECHTHTEKGKKLGEPFAGGFAFNFPNGSTLRSPNITPHPTDGIGAWDKATFIARFKMYADSSYVPRPIDWNAADFQTVMPWMMYATMSEEDLGAIYDYLRAVPPVSGKVEKWTPPAGGS
ncbi:MAG: c-type cytochrome [Flavobacteriales bacterium]|nr:c-type cytochrome [Flavobacteriales bacterium]